MILSQIDKLDCGVVGWDNRSSSFWPRSSDHFDHFGKHQSGIYMPQGPEFIRCDYPNPLPISGAGEIDTHILLCLGCRSVVGVQTPFEDQILAIVTNDENRPQTVTCSRPQGLDAITSHYRLQ